MERKIGEVFQDGEVKLKVEPEINLCVGCYYRQFNDCPNKRNESSCESSGRSDNQEVIFIQITQ